MFGKYSLIDHDIFNISIKNFLKTSIGFSDAFQAFVYDYSDEVSSFPHYNIRVLDNGNEIIEMALAGYGKEDIDVTVGDTSDLTISGGNYLTKMDGDYMMPFPAKKSDKLGKELNKNYEKSEKFEKEEPVIEKEYKKDGKELNTDFVHQGVSRKRFCRRFQLAPHVEVEKVVFKNGMLYVLMKNTRKERAGKKLTISDS